MPVLAWSVRDVSPAKTAACVECCATYQGLASCVRVIELLSSRVYVIEASAAFPRDVAGVVGVLTGSWCSLCVLVAVHCLRSRFRSSPRCVFCVVCGHLVVGRGPHNQGSAAQHPQSRMNDTSFVVEIRDVKRHRGNGRLLLLRLVGRALVATYSYSVPGFDGITRCADMSVLIRPVPLLVGLHFALSLLHKVPEATEPVISELRCGSCLQGAQSQGKGGMKSLTEQAERGRALWCGAPGYRMCTWARS